MWHARRDEDRSGGQRSLASALDVSILAALSASPAWRECPSAKNVAAGADLARVTALSAPPRRDRAATEMLVRSPQRVRLLMAGWATFVSSFLLEGFAIVRADHAWFVHRLPDDAFYYLEIAQRMARGQGTTVDGIHATNGFHPLWQFALAGLAFLTGGDALVRSSLLLSLACTACALLIVQRVLSRIVGHGPALIAVLVAAHPFATVVVLTDGMESAVVVLALAAMVVALEQAVRRSDDTGAAYAGLAAGLVVLARVDFAIVLVAVPIVVAWRGGRRRFGYVTAGAAAVALLPWALWSQFAFGHVLPVSGYIKLHSLTGDINARFGGRLTTSYGRYTAGLGVDYFRALGIGAGLQGHPISGFILEITAIVGMWVAFRAWRRSHHPPTSVAVACGTVAAMIGVKAMTDLVTLPYWAQAWYSAPARVTFGIALGLGGFWAFRAARPGFALGAAAIVAILLTGVLPSTGADASMSSSERPAIGLWQDASALAVTWIRHHPGGGIYGSTDSGLLSYELDPIRVVNLDGLVNSYTYARALLAGVPPLERYRVEGVRYLVERGTPGDGRVPSCATVTWQSPWPIGYGGGADSTQTTFIHLGIFDLSTCPS